MLMTTPKRLAMWTMAATVTNILLDGSTPAAMAVDALKFIVHFIGDIHQPLHAENLDKGGNGINVTNDGTRTNLHHIWDTNMPEYDAGGYSLDIAQKWASMLTTRIKSAEYVSKSASWLDGLDVKDPINSAMLWARDANSYVCSTVLKPVIEELIARAGYRLAAWLDAIASKTPRSDILKR